MNVLELITTAWLAGMIVTYVTVSAGISRDEANRFLATRLWLTVTWPVMTMGFVAWWTTSYTWRRLTRKTEGKS